MKDLGVVSDIGENLREESLEGGVKLTAALILIKQPFGI